MENSFKYRAFITYAHEDENQARWLRRKLESFPVPKNLVGKKGKFGKIPSRLYPIFRDRDELPGSAQLGSVIEHVVDINPHRQGMFMPGTGQQIVPPEFLKEIRPDIVIVMNRVYEQEIRDDLQRMELTPRLLTL